MAWDLALMTSLAGKTPRERFRIIEDHVKKCRAKFEETQSDLIMAERMMADASRDYMHEYFGEKR